MPTELKIGTWWKGLRLGAAVVGLGLLAAIGCGEGRATTSPDADQLASVSGRVLIECPSTATTSTQALIGPLGGLVSLGGHLVEIPSGVLQLPTLITITAPASRYMEIDVTANALASFTFSSKVKVTIDYSRCERTDIDLKALTVWHIDSRSKALLENMGGVDDKGRRRITFETDHFSGYAIAN